MSQSKAQGEALRLVGLAGDITPCGTSTTREQGSLYGLLPADQARGIGIVAGTELVIGYHAASSTFLHAPVSAVDADHWAAEFVGLGE